MNEEMNNKLLFKIMLEKTYVEKINKIKNDQNINGETIFIEALESFKTKHIQTDNYTPKFTDFNTRLIITYTMRLASRPLEDLALLSSKFRLSRVQLIREVFLSYLEDDKDKSIESSEAKRIT